MIDFFYRNKNRFAWIGATIGAAYWITKWAASSFIQEQIKREKEHCAKSNITRRFEQNLLDVEFVVSSLISVFSCNFSL